MPMVAAAARFDTNSARWSASACDARSRSTVLAQASSTQLPVALHADVGARIGLQGHHEGLGEAPAGIDDDVHGRSYGCVEETA